MIIGLTGLAACGKSTISHYLKNSHNFQFLIFSDILKEEAKKRGLFNESMPLEEQKMTLSRFGDQWRKETGKNDIIAIKLIEKIKEENLENIVIDGFRAPAEVDLFRENFKDFTLIFVDTSVENRFERRKLDDPNTNLEDLQKRDKSDIDNKSMDKVFETADKKIENNRTKEELYEKIENIINLKS